MNSHFDLQANGINVWEDVEAEPDKPLVTYKPDKVTEKIQHSFKVIGANNKGLMRYNISKWTTKYKLWTEFYETHKRRPIYAFSGPSENMLANWQTYQIKKFNRGILPKNQLDKLESTNGWSWISEKELKKTQKFKKKKDDEDDDYSEPEPEEESDTEPEEPPPKRRRLDSTWVAEKEQVKYAEKISELEAENAKLKVLLQKQTAIMLQQKSLIQELEK